MAKKIKNSGYVYGDDYTSAVDRLTHYFGNEDTISIQVTVVADTDYGVMVTTEDITK